MIKNRLILVRRTNLLKRKIMDIGDDAELNDLIDNTGIPEEMLESYDASIVDTSQSST